MISRNAFHTDCLFKSAYLCCVQGGAELVPFDPYAPQPKMIHKGGYQPKYFVMDSFEVRESWNVTTLNA